MNSTTQVTFKTVHQVKQKLTVICSLVEQHFQRAEKVLLLVPNEAAARYLDQLLWSHPPESFLPHTISSRPIAAAIVISQEAQNLNQAQVLINLCPAISPIAGEFKQVFELFDCTDSAKEELSKKRLEAYQQLGYAVTVEEIAALV